MKLAPDAPRAVASGVVGAGAVALCLFLFIETGHALFLLVGVVITIGTIANLQALWRGQIPPSERDPDRP